MGPIRADSVQTYILFLKLFFASGVGFPLYPEISFYFTMILQRYRIIVGDARFETGTSAPEVWCATNEPPHLLIFLFNYYPHNRFWVVSLAELKDDSISSPVVHKSKHIVYIFD